MLKKSCSMLFSALLLSSALPAVPAGAATCPEPAASGRKSMVIAPVQTEPLPCGPYVQIIQVETEDSAPVPAAEPQETVEIQEPLQNEEAAFSLRIPADQDQLSKDVHELFVDEQEAQAQNEEIHTLLAQLSALNSALEAALSGPSETPEETEDEGSLDAAVKKEELEAQKEALLQTIAALQQQLADLSDPAEAENEEEPASVPGSSEDSFPASEPEEPDQENPEPAEDTAFETEEQPLPAAGPSDEEGLQEAENGKDETAGQAELLCAQLAQAQAQLSALEEALAALDEENPEEPAADVQDEKAGTQQAPASVSADMPGLTPNLHVLSQQAAALEAEIQDLLENTADNADQEQIRSLQARIEDLSAQIERLEVQPVYRLYNPNSGEHFYTTDENERTYLSGCGWKYEGLGWYAPKHEESQPVYRLFSPRAGDHHYTTDAREVEVLASKYEWKYEGIA